MKRIISMLLCLFMFAAFLTTATSAATQFTDVADGDYFAVPVEWAVAQGITNGTSNTTFSPNDTCTRAQILTFLWRAAGSPETVAFLDNPYLDIDETGYYYKAALWAKAGGMVEGYLFEPDTPCTRGATVEYFWKFAGWQMVESIPFSDVKADSELEKAVSWAVDYGITNGTGGTTFSPDQTCTRGQIVTFLHRNFVAALDNSQLISTLRTTASVGDTINLGAVSDAGAASGTGSSAALGDAAASSANQFSGYDGELDPLPPEDYTLQPDWYGSLTPAHTMSNARLVAEYERIEAAIEDFRVRDIYMSDGPYSRDLDLWSQLSQRCDVVERYDRGVRNGSPADWVVEEYNELVAAHGDVECLRKYI